MYSLCHCTCIRYGYLLARIPRCDLDISETLKGKCPSRLNCILKRRLPCASFESKTCGPCMPQYVEDQSGNCELKQEQSKFVGPEEMIDFFNKMAISGSKVTRGQHVNQNGTGSTKTETTSQSPTASTPHLPQLLNESTRTEPMSQSSLTANEWKMSSLRKSDFNQTISLALIVICSLTAFSGVLVAALCWYRLQKEVHLTQKMAYSAYKGTRQPPCQRSANENSHFMWQYHDVRKQRQAQSGSGTKPRQQLSTDSEADIEEFTMYECPGLAPAGEMEVHNPLFDPLPAKQ
ncbi:neural proliferation differentiation and control protein 1-like isoform X2 [Pelobates fuscus]|uniref:neural proliferation differentiation and control protein 1-like isoform X2 n=1 Tax=Pelobates fuscus TaxID=191477 RepID=UPI002FE4B5AB